MLFVKVDKRHNGELVKMRDWTDFDNPTKVFVEEGVYELETISKKPANPLGVDSVWVIKGTKIGHYQPYFSEFIGPRRRLDESIEVVVTHRTVRGFIAKRLLQLLDITPNCEKFDSIFYNRIGKHFSYDIATNLHIQYYWENQMVDEQTIKMTEAQKNILRVFELGEINWQANHIIHCCSWDFWECE